MTRQMMLRWPASLRVVALLAVALLVGVLLSGWARAESFDIYQFDTPEQEARFDHLIDELRCPKCQNNNLADSNAPIARDLRQRTYELLREGRSDQEIIDYLKARYGDFISYKPPFNGVTSLLWAGPLLLLLGAGSVLIWRLRRRATAVKQPDPERVRAILSQFDDASREDRQ